jgi:DNA-binding NtrC family response regulator
MARILIVDSYRNLDALYLEILESEGHCVFIATSGKEAVGIATREHIDLAIVDEKLPDCKSENLIKELNVIEPHRTVCSVTEFGSLSASALCEERFIKSSDTKALKEKIESLLKKDSRDSSVVHQLKVDND